MGYIIGAVWVLIELFCFILFCGAFFDRKKSNNQTTIIFFLWWIITLIYTNMDILAPSSQILTLVMAVLFSFIIYSGDWLKQVLIILLCFIFIAIVDTAVLFGESFLVEESVQRFTERKLFYVTVVTIGKLITLFLAWLICKYRRSISYQSIQSKWLWLTLLFPVVSLLLLMVIFNTYQDSNDLSIGAVFASVILAIANIAILYIVHDLEKSTQEKQEMVILSQQMEIQTQSMIALERSYREQRKSSHEFQHHLVTLNDLLEDDEIDTAKEYVNKLKRKQTVRVLAVNSNHPVIDAVLNQKYQLALENDIEMHIEVNDLAQVAVREEALVVILANLLDNAIEGCQRMGNGRAIHCKIYSDDGVFIGIRNTSLPVNIIKGKIQTTKTPKEEHGYGLPNVRHILEQLNADYTFNYEDGWFQFLADIP